MPIRNNLRVLMAKQDIKSLSELSRRTKFHYNTIRNFSLGMHQRLDSDLVVSLCKELNCDISDLLYIEKKKA